MNPVKKTHPRSKSQPHSASKTKYTTSNLSLFDRVEIILSRHLPGIFWVSFALTFILGALLFDIRFSISGDDSAYVVRAYDFIHHFTFPGFQGPLYPIALSPVVAIFGLGAAPLKCFSLLCILAFFYLSYISLKNRIPALLLASMLLLVSVNSFILYYGSQTYSEAFFMFVQALTFCLFFAYFVDDKAIKSPWVLGKQHLILAFCLLCMGLTRFIGFSAVIAIGVYFVLNKQWKNLLYITTSFVILVIIYQAFIYLLSGHSAIQADNAFQALISKDYYKPALGHETLTGFIKRLAVNSNYYFSKSFYSVIGLRSPDESGGVNPVIAVLTWLMIIWSAIMAFRRNSYVFFLAVYVIITAFIMFFISHVIWMQSRFIIPFVSLILLVMISSLYYFFGLKQWVKFQVILPLLVLILFGFSVRITAGRVKETRKIADKFYGLTPDWENYCKLSRWIGNNLPENATVACRKSSISFLNSEGKKFFGITRLPFYSGDSLLQDWRRKNPHYYLIQSASLNNQPVSEKLFREFKKGILGYGMNVRSNFYEAKFYIMDFNEISREETLKELNKIGISVTDNADSLEAWLKVPGTEMSIIYPDSVLKILFDAHVTHVLTDNIRAYPDRKNQNIVTTVERFMNFIDSKYPGIRTKIMQIGADDNEPASLYVINYDQAGLQGPQ
mgnify:CR=1 FL=1